MNLCWCFAHLSNESNLSNWLSLKAKQLMKTGYNLIGDSILPAHGFFVFNFLQQFIDFKKLRQIKRKQIEFYENALINLPRNIFQEVTFKNSDKDEMMAYPLILSIKNAKNILNKIRVNGLLLDFELDDSQWSKKHKIIYLPLGPHITKDNLEEIVNKLILIYFVYD